MEGLREQALIRTGAIHIVVPGAIVPWKRAQRRRFANGVHVTFTDREVEAYHAVVRMAAREVMRDQPPIADPIMLSLLAVFPVPSSWSGKRQREALSGLRHKASRPDMENTIKGALDAMQSVVYRDDAQIIGYRSCFKVYGDRPRLEIVVEPLLQGTAPACSLPPDWREQDSIGSYNVAVAAIGERVRAGEPVPQFMRSRRSEAAE